jgi:hypothetical protein
MRKRKAEEEKEAEKLMFREGDWTVGLWEGGREIGAMRLCAGSTAEEDLDSGRGRFTSDQARARE